MGFSSLNARCDSGEPKMRKSARSLDSSRGANQSNKIREGFLMVLEDLNRHPYVVSKPYAAL
jgi:hypothetical protein